MAYNEKVIDHFNNPRNVGSLDKSDVNVGTGIVGAPECFSGDTEIATADGSRQKTLYDIYQKGDILPVWSFNIEKRIFEIKNAKAIFTGRKITRAIEFSDGGVIYATPDHEFLLRPTYTYLKNSEIADESIRPFRRYVSKRGYWRIRDTKDGFEYLSYFKFNNPLVSLNNKNVHHKDHDKRNDYPSNLKSLTVSEHLDEHRDDHKQEFLPTCSKDIIEKALNNTYARPEAANILNIFADELYSHIRHYGLQGVEKRKTKKEICEMASERMLENNPYSNFTEEQKKEFASHPGEANGRWIDVSEESLLWHANFLYRHTGKFTSKTWRKFAKKFKFPQNITSRFSSWNDFKDKVINYNHKIIKIHESVEKDCYTLQVEENNNYVVLTKKTKNTNEGIVVKNCGDVMRLQLKIVDDIITDAKFKTFGCGSAIASSSLATEWVVGKTLDEAYKIKNIDFVEELCLPPVKIHCSVLAEDAIKAAIKDYKDKNVDK